MNTIHVDARGCACPEPVLKVKKAMEQTHDIIEVWVDNNTAVQNISRFATGKGYRMTIAEPTTQEFQLTIQK